MYAEHFGLTRLPFSLTPNTEFFLNAGGHRDALNLMLISLAEGEGFIKVVGEVGTGKTMLCRELLGRLDETYFSAYIPNPFLSTGSLFRTLAEELGISIRTRDGISELLQKINRRLVELVANGKKVVLVIDEAQAIPPKTMEALRLISNLETEKSKLIHIVLLGQPELDKLLDLEGAGPGGFAAGTSAHHIFLSSPGYGSRGQ
jgi:MSHA biogenesis protein MshM